MIRIANYLNEQHNIDAPTRFWRIIIGCWLLHFLSIFLDCYVSIKRGNPYTFVPGKPEGNGLFSEIPYDFNSFFRSATVSNPVQFRARLCIQIQIFMERKNFFEEGEKGLYRKKNITRPRQGYFKRYKIGCIEALSKLSLHAKPDTIIHGQIPVSAMLRLVSKNPFGTGFLFNQFEGDLSDSTPISWGKRLKLNKLKADDQFEATVIGLLPFNLPSLYLEGFTKAYSCAKNKLGRSKPKVFCTVGGLFEDESAKFFAAEAYRRGTRILSVQHGGFYGTARLAPIETLERKISDRFYSWGWSAFENDCRLSKIPSIKLSTMKVRNSTESARHKGILLCGTEHPKFLYRFQSCPVGPQWNAYFENTLKFTSCISNELLPRLIFRPYGANNQYEWNVVGFLRKNIPDICIDDRSLSFEQKIYECRLVVVDHNATLILQTLACNIPTVIFFDRKMWELRNYAAPFFDMLMDVGIMFEDPKLAAQHVQKVYSDINTWWESDDTREAVRMFTKHFALSSSHWAKDWLNILKKEALLSVGDE